MVVQEVPFTGTVEIDEFYLGGRLKRSPDAPPPGRGRQGQRRTTKAPVPAMVQKPEATTIGRRQGMRALESRKISRLLKPNRFSSLALIRRPTS